MQHDEAVHRPHELRVAGAPAHELRNRQPLQSAFDLRGEHFAQHRAFRLDARHDDRPLGRVASAKLGHGDAVLAREAGDRLLGCARRRTGDFAFAPRCARSDTADRERQAPRRRIHGERRLGVRQGGLCECGEHVLGERFRECTQRFRRQLLSQELDEQRGAHVTRPGRPRV